MATHALTTSVIAPGNATTRRYLLAGIAGTTLASGVLAVTKLAPPSQDLELLAACARYHRLHAIYMGPFVSDEQTDMQGEERRAALDLVAATSATTQAGLEAKARVTLGAMMFDVDALLSVPWRDQATLEQALAIDVLRGFLGEQTV